MIIILVPYKKGLDRAAPEKQPLRLHSTSIGTCDRSISLGFFWRTETLPLPGWLNLNIETVGWSAIDYQKRTVFIPI
jgi:hypothetical protein